ncbi:MAG: S41 family peptidase [Defluviitaleaceae bacterium]|nr:S41 family peptidase [Defluviitaleaceae bacterium]
MRRRAGKPYLSAIEQTRKQYLRFKVISLTTIALLLGGLGAMVYVNYDYMLFRHIMTRHYIHTETMDTLFAGHLGFVPDGYGRHFDNLVISIVTREIRGVDGDRYTYQYTPAQHVAQQERVRVRAASAEFYEAAAGVGYLFLPNISPYVRDFVFDNREEINGFDNLILDLRGNNGGTLDDFQAIAGLFLERGATIGRETARWGIFSAHRRSRGDKFFEFDNIVILQNERTASAAEGLIMALAENLDNTTIVGVQTYGKGIGQATLPLRGGFAVRATVILIETPLGFTVHNVGITPDIEYDGEGIVEFALGLIDNG